MPYFLNVVYFLALLVLSPWLLYKALTTGKYRRGVGSKFFGRTSFVGPSARQPVIWFHGVSVGEVHLLRQVHAVFRARHPDWQCVVSSTTDTGFDEARKSFPGLPVTWWPLDFSWAVCRALDEVRPDVVVLAEAEVWPNFLLEANRRGIPVAVVNARMSPRSHGRYRRLQPLVRRHFGGVALFAVQTEDYAAALRDLGVAPERVHVTGSVKYDGAESDRANSRTRELRRLFDVADGDLVWVAGSTQAPEEEVALGIYRRAREEHPNLRLLLVPRQKERFEEVAALLRQSGLPFVRRSELSGPVADRGAVVLVDTIGELGAVWGLADVAFVGGSLDGRRGGQNLLEPAAYGAAVLVGPHVWNFREAVGRLKAAGGAVQVQDAAELETTLRQLFADADRRRRLGEAARELVRREQGATVRTLDLLEPLLVRRPRQSRRLAG